MPELLSNPRIVVALDYADIQSARSMVEQLDPSRCRLKVGKELFTRCGPAFVEELVEGGFDVFLDLKFHDIPNTTAKACQAAADLGVWMINVHASGGEKMMRAARKAVDECVHQPILIAVTVLTSMGQTDLNQLGVEVTPAEQVSRLAGLAKSSGMDGVVCSPQEVAMLHQQWSDACLVTPGIRPEWSATGDQVRIMTPLQAIELGASYLVIGRPITEAQDPMTALQKIENELAIAKA